MLLRTLNQGKTRKKDLLLCTALVCSLVMGSLSGCGVHQQEKYDSASVVADKALEEFMKLAAVPRPSFHTEKALAYLQDFADNHGFTNYHDDYGNFWMDVPATKGYEDYPKVILQGHMDMVCVSDPGVDIDFETTGITTVVSDDTITADGTTLGADDGAGIGTMLAICESNVAHGPLRVLVTTDEEVGLLGAEALDESAIDSDYLINIDDEEAGKITYSTAGGLQVTMKNQYDTKPVNSGDTVWKLEVGNLLGGHSGVEIDKNRLSAVTALTMMLQGVMDADIPIGLISINIGEFGNVIAPSGSVTFAVSTENEEKLTKILQDIEDSLSSQYPDKNMECTLLKQDAEGMSEVSVKDSSKLIELIQSLPQGVISMSKKIDGLVETSSNTGVVKLTDGFANIEVNARSCVTKELDKLETDFCTQSDKYGYSCTTNSKYPGWDGDPDSPLLKLSAKAYEETGVEPELQAVHAGLESSWFTTKRAGIQMIAIGPTITGAHTTSETLKPKTIEPMVPALLYCLANINAI